jgi:glycosyltransferase 2 family protein
MKAFTILFAICGVLAGTALVGYFGFDEVGRALFAVRWTGFLAIIAYHLAGIFMLGLCWHVLTPNSAPLLAFVWGRLIRDSGSEVLPLSQLGGFIMGARAATLLGLSGAAAIASTIVDVTLEMLGQLGYTTLGLGILAWQKPDNYLIGWTADGLVVALVAMLGFIAVQRRGLGMVERAVLRIAQQWVKGSTVQSRSVQHEIHDIYRRHGALCMSGLLHFAAWIANSVEAWFALRLMGADLGIASVIAIESLLYAIRSVAFAVPNAVGVQEGAYIMLGAAFGLTPETALALSLLKRARDLVIGVPALLMWQVLESRRLLARSAAVDETVSEPVVVPVRNEQ